MNEFDATYGEIRETPSRAVFKVVRPGVDPVRDLRLLRGLAE
jgi:hypothetical protein